MTNDKMTPPERRAAMSLAGIFALRMLGLFMILPVFSLYAHNLRGVTPTLIGIAIGVYGLTQALLQIPMGVLSDRIGRKPVILGGLVLFAVGSVVAAMADSITMVIIGRALQGSGAIAAAITALAADLTREEHRTKVMAIIGTSIGVAFAISLISGPILNHWIGVPGIFWLTAVLAVVAMWVVAFRVPQPQHSGVHRDAEPVPSQLLTVLKDAQLLRLDFGIFVLHMLLTASFVVLPLALRDHAGLDARHHWFIYLPVILISMAAMVPFVITAEKKRRMKQVFVGAIAVMAAAEIVLGFGYSSVWGIVAGLLLFFTGFNLLEATLPSMIAKFAPPDKKGSAMGVYSTSQFLGAFTGGAVGGYLFGVFGPQGVFDFCFMAALLWLGIALGMRQPRYVSSMMLHIGKVSSDQAQQIADSITGIRGVAEAVVVAEEGVAYLKVDRKILDETELENAVAERGALKPTPSSA